MKDSRAHIAELVDIVKARLGTNGPGPDTENPVRIAFYWVARYFESRGYTFYSNAQAAKPEKTKLAERGWFRKWRVPSMIDPNRRPPRCKMDPLRRDPIARAARSVYIDQTQVKTPEELIKDAGRTTGRGEPDVADLPANPKELHDHLVEIAPALQTRYRFPEEESVVYGMSWREYMEICRPGYLRTDLWVSAKTEQTLWVFTAFRMRRRASDRGVIWSVWEKVKAIEKLAEDISEPLVHEPEGDEDWEIRQAVETLYLEGSLVSFVEQTRNQP
jgi:hypothetical protein